MRGEKGGRWGTPVGRLEGIWDEVRLVRVVEGGDGELELVRDLLCTDYVNTRLRVCTEVVYAL